MQLRGVSNGGEPRRRRKRLIEAGLPPKFEIFDHWKTRFEEAGLFVDWGEPGCWACGLHYGNKYDVRGHNSTWAHILRAWDRIPLQRCHIVARSLGGSDTVDNLFLMCRECHDLQPNTSLPEIFFDWAKRQSWLSRVNVRFDDAFRSLGVDEAETSRIADCLLSDDFKKWAKGRAALHFPQSGYAGLGRQLSFATLFGLAKTYLRSR